MFARGISELLQGILFFLLPFFISLLVKKYKVFEYLGPVILAYGIGILLANLPLFSLSSKVSELLTECTVPLAIPLLLFSNDIKAWLGHAKVALISFGLAVFSVIFFATLIAPLFQESLPEVWKLSGMLVGVYTGGTPNMASIGLALEVEKSHYLLLNTADMILGGFYLLGLMTVLKPLLNKILPEYEASHLNIEENELNLQSKGSILDILSGLGLSIVIVLMSAGLSFLLVNKISVPIVMLALTTFSIGASFNTRIQHITGSYELGNYFILVFCIAIGSLIQVDSLFKAGSNVLYFCALVMFGSICLHVLLAKLFKIDVDTTIITSTAAIYGPAFVGPVAAAIGNKKVIVSGLTTGLLGYAVGNYVGLMVAYLVKSWLG